MHLGIDDKTAVVLASTGGLGRAVAESLLAEGATVAICGRDSERFERARAELAAAHPERVLGANIDVTDRAALTAHLDAVAEQTGAIDILVTNAGGPPPCAALDVTHEGLDQAWDLTLQSAVHAVQAVLPGMRERGFGRILAMTSLTVRHPSPSLAYSNIVRAGLTAYFKTLADDVGADGVLVNTVCTGMFGTERLDELFEARALAAGTTIEAQRDAAVASIPVGRVGSLGEFGDLCAFLVSARNTFVHGANVPIDGGAGRFLL